MSKKTIKFIDLFAGLGGIRIGFENAFKNQGFKTQCVLTSEIKPYAIKNLSHNFPAHDIKGDISKIDSKSIPKFDYLLAGFPCQPFSSGGKRQGFSDTRGTLFFEIERILRDKQPEGFILENVEGLVRHDLKHPKDKIGNTLSTILRILESDLEYNVSWKVLNSQDFGLPQARKRIFIVGSKTKKISLEHFQTKRKSLESILESGLPTLESDFTKKIFSHFNTDDLYGKSIKDKRGGDNNIHSWDIGLKGECSKDQINLLNTILKERRKKHWAEKIGIDWMDGMTLTFDQISSFAKIDQSSLKEELDQLTKMGYLKFEHPKKLIIEKTPQGEKKYREFDLSKPKGYNIVSGKLSFEINKILDPKDVAPTIVATDVSKLAVVDNSGLRKISIREGLRLFGFPETYQIIGKESEAFDLLGNTVAVPVIEAVCERFFD